MIGAKTADPHPKLKGTIYTAAKEGMVTNWCKQILMLLTIINAVEDAGGKCLPIQLDIRDEEQVKKAIDATVQKFGGLDVLVNNASAISLTNTSDTTMKRYDLMHSVNARGTFLVSKYASEHLKKSSHGHILTLSPPLDMRPQWFKPHVAYSMAKYGMSMCVLGMAEEFKDSGVAVNALWPRTTIWTAAMEMLGGDHAKNHCRKEEIMSDAGYAILTKNPREFTGNFCIDEEVLRNEGITDFEQYAVTPGEKLSADFFLPEKYLEGLTSLYDLSSEGSSESTGSSGAEPASKVFEEMAGRVNDEVKKEINAVMAFVISGKNWFVDAHSTRPFQVTREEKAKPDVTFIMDDETFMKMASGETKAANAFMSGKLKVKGNLAIAMKAEKIFGKIRPKL